MTDIIAETAAQETSLEQRLFRRLPFGPFGCAAFVFACTFASYVLVALAAGLKLPQIFDDLTFDVGTGTWSAAVLSLLFAAIVTLVRYGDEQEMRDAREMALVFKGGARSAARLVQGPGEADRRRRTIAGTIGALAGPTLLIIFSTQGTIDLPLAAVLRTTAAWFFVITPILFLMMGRGIVETAYESRTMRELVRDELVVDLLAVDRLNVFGRRAVRGVLMWLTPLAITFLFAIRGQQAVMTVPVLVVSSGCAALIFLSTMREVHRRIRTTKRAELDLLNTRIARERAALLDANDAGAAQRLPALMALEARIADVREWPFDMPTLVRLALYALIPVIPWFGTAIVEQFINRSLN